MGKLFLDENDLVQFDPSQDASWARRAATGRQLLRMTETTRELLRAVEVLRARTGRMRLGEATHARLELDRIRHRLRAQARRRASTLAILAPPS